MNDHRFWHRLDAIAYWALMIGSAVLLVQIAPRLIMIAFFGGGY